MTDAWTVVRGLHLLAMAVFVGGQVVLAVAVVPALRGEGSRPVLRAVARRFGWVSLAALGVLVPTGAAMATHYGVWDDGRLQLKLGLLGAAVLFILWHTRRPELHALQGLVFLLSLGIVWLGVALSHAP